MADEGVSPWLVEPIPDTDQLFKRIHRKLFKPDGRIMTGAFEHTEMSVDWSRYSTPAETQQREGNAAENAVVNLSVAEVRRIPGQTVGHTPKKGNRSHSHVKGKKNAEAKMRLRDAAEIVLRVPLQ
ncbi:MAG: hypothetical protein HOP29_04975 [Phycisphaerales bacterium]|nr:hypothetical protein [Phycisphaerales bacterium]